MQRPAIRAGGDLLVGLGGLLEREVLGEGHDALEQRVKPLEAVEIQFRQLHRAYLAVRIKLESSVTGRKASSSAEPGRTAVLTLGWSRLVAFDGGWPDEAGPERRSKRAGRRNRRRPCAARRTSAGCA